MSYILDALKRADAERARGTVPGLHAQPVATPGRIAPSARTGRWLAIAAALVLGSIAAGVGWRYGPTAGVPATAATPLVPVVPAGPATLPQPAQAPVAEVLPRVLPPKPPQGVHAVPAPAAPIRPAPVRTVVTQTPPAPPSIPATLTAVRTETSTPAAGAVKPSGALSNAGAAPLRNALPEELQRQIPALTVTGAVASDNPAQRLLLVNGQVLPQGGSPAPEVTIVEISAQSSLLSFRGTRFRLAH